MGYFDHIMNDAPPQQGAPAAPAAGGGQPASALYDVVRSLGTGLRGGVEAAIGLPEDVGHGMRFLNDKARGALGFGNDPDYVAGKDQVRGPETEEVKAATTEKLGPHYKPETLAGEYTRTIGEFAPMAVLGGSPISSLGRSLIGGAVIPGAASEAAGQATEGTAAEPWARAAGGLAGGVAGGVAALERYPRNLKQARRGDVTDAGARQGVGMPSYMMPDAPAASQMAERMVDIPFLGGPVRAASERTARRLGERTDEIAAGVGNPDMASATHGAHDALRRFQTTTSRDFKTSLYDDVDRAITRPHITTPLRETQITTRNILDEADTSTVRSHQQAIDLVREAISRPQGLTYEGIKQLRTDIGARMSGKITAEPGTNQPLLKRIYAALTHDLEQAVQNSGGQAAVDAWRHANRTTRVLEEVSAAVAKVIGKKGEITPQNAMKTIVHLATARDPSVRNRLNMVQMAMEDGQPGAWNDVAASVLAHMGRDPKRPADFSPSRFNDSFSKMSREGRNLLFGNQVADSLEDLALLSRTHKDLTRPSKFGIPVQMGMGGVVGAAAFANWPATLTAAFGANMVARLMSRPATAQKLVSWARAREGALRGSPAAYMQASKTFADAIATETGQDASEVLDKLLDMNAGATTDGRTGGEDDSAD